MSFRGEAGEGSDVSLGHWPICRVDVRELVARRLELRSKGLELIW